MVGTQGATLGKMKSLNVPIPATFIISTASTEAFHASKDMSQLMVQCRKGVAELESETGKRFEQPGKGGIISKLHAQVFREESRADRPLLLSLRAVASFPMPEVTESLLSCGMNTDLLNVLAHDADNAHWAYESYSQFLQTWGTVVDGIDHNRFANIVREVRSRAGVLQGFPMDIETLKILVQEFKQIVHPPEDPFEQLEKAVESIINFWYTTKAEKYEDIYGLENPLRVAIIVQTMVFGNMDAKSGAGVAFSRSPVTGEPEHMTEFMPKSSRYELLFQEREPLHLQELNQFRPEVFYKLQHVLKLHESNFKDAHMLEFVVEKGIFYLVHAAVAQRSAFASIRIAVDMVKHKAISEQEALMRFDPFILQQLIEPIIDPAISGRPISSPYRRHMAPIVEVPGEELFGERTSYNRVGKGVPASYGAVTGTLVFTSQEAIECRRRGVKCILCLPQSSANDIGGLEAANGVISLLGGIGSFAAIWMRSMGKPAITGVRDFCYDVPNKRMLGIHTKEVLYSGELVTIDGSTGDIYSGDVPKVTPPLNEDGRIVLKWAKAHKGIKVYSVAKDAREAHIATDNGADGIEMYDTDQLFTRPDRIELLRTILIANNESVRSMALTEMQVKLKDDFVEMLRVVRDCDVIIRLLDTSLYNVLPTPADPDFEEDLRSLAEKLNMSVTDCLQKLEDLHEPNPLMGMRGCRLLFMQPYLLAIQVRAIGAAAIVLNNEGITVRPRVQMPVAFSDQELTTLMPLAREALTEAAIFDFQASPDAKQRALQCELGISLAVPRACLRSDRFANIKEVNFVTINTDEITQLVFGIEKNAAKRIMVCRPYPLLQCANHLVSRCTLTGTCSPAIPSSAWTHSPWAS